MGGVDIWLQSEIWAAENTDSYPEKLKGITTEQQAAILRLKYHLIREGSYGKTYYSADVYDAVLAGILTVEDFKANR